ncbi:MAG TPA: hypothetical protein DHW82_01815 [Spirochaetia bacterium]|nr:MAG: hypothetical protein A2Y41_13860 [Spirochaetes bacterium GWB1_36_13]HCL55732.1 hypothetical protein [Spirochaetia bacterium]
MKKLLSFLAVMALLVSLVSCGGAKGETTAANTEPEIPQAKVTDAPMGPMPSWVIAGDSVGVNSEKQKVIFFIGYGESKDLSTAKEAAQLNAAAAAAKAIKSLVTAQVARAWESIGSGEDESKEQVMKGLEAQVSKNVDVSGMLKGDQYYRQVVKPKIVNGKLAGWSTPMYEYYVRYSMEYDRYIAARDGVLDQKKKETKLNDRQKKLYADMESKLDELDASTEEEKIQ